MIIKLILISIENESFRLKHTQCIPCIKMYNNQLRKLYNYFRRKFICKRRIYATMYFFKLGKKVSHNGWKSFKALLILVNALKHINQGMCIP